jgi:hypothetical protein
MQERIIEELHRVETELRSMGFKQSVIDPVMQVLETESFSMMEAPLAEERLDNYFRFLNHKLGVIKAQFINKRRLSNLEDAEVSRLWRHRANFQKGRIEGILPESELSRALKFLIDKSFEL